MACDIELKDAKPIKKKIQKLPQLRSKEEIYKFDCLEFGVSVVLIVFTSI